MKKVDMTKKFTFPESLWAGTDHSLILAMEAYDAMMAGMFDQSAQQQESAVPHNFSVQGDIGVVTIRGPLVNNDSPYNMYRGVTSYSDIRKAMIYGATQEGIKAILLDIDSGGGAVSGVSDVGNLISSIDKSIKPVYAFTDGTMASAAYWLGVSSRGVWVSQTAMSGSIGVISTHQEYSKAFKAEGVGVTVMRAGEFKALANSMEPLTEVAQNQIQSQLNAAYGVFAGHVADRLGMSLAVFDTTAGQGREFFGASAVDAGLAKGVKTYDSMISMISQKVIDSSAKKDNTPSNYQKGVPMTRHALTEQQIAAIAAGAGEHVAEIIQPAVALAAAEPVVVADVVHALTEHKKENDQSGLISYLQSQVKEKDAELLAQSVELVGIKAKVASIEATHTGLVKIAALSVSNMRVGLRLAKADFTAMSPEVLLAEHASTSLTFATAFKVGGVSAVAAPETKVEFTVDSNHAGRIAATQFSPKK